MDEHIPAKERLEAFQEQHMVAIETSIETGQEHYLENDLEAAVAYLQKWHLALQEENN